MLSTVTIPPTEEAPECEQKPNEDFQGEEEGGYQMGKFKDLGTYTFPVQHY